MKIPAGANGFPLVSPTMLRRYGSAGFTLDEGEEQRGCPRLFRKQYVEHAVPFESSYRLEYGSVFHRVMERLETTEDTPEEALLQAFTDIGYQLPPDAFEEAVDDLRKYMERGATPRDQYAMLAVEKEYAVHLYDDEEHGPIWIRGILDWVGVDPENPRVIHGVDYKTNRGKSTYDKVRADVQMRFYDLVLALFYSDQRPLIVMHLDEIKFDNGDISVTYTPAERDAFRSWLIAVIRHILRDEKGAPKLNPGCAWCPVRASCPAYRELPEVAKQVYSLKPPEEGETTATEVMAWRDSAWRMKGLLEKAVKEIDEDFKQKAVQAGGLEVGPYQFELETRWVTEVDMQHLHELLGVGFYNVATVTKAALQRVTKDMDPSDADEIMGTIKSVPDGTEIKKKKARKT